VSHEYPQRWVQALAYSAATIVTVSRFMARDYWSSDVLVGSALGIGIGAHIFHAHCDPQLSDSCKHHVQWILTFARTHLKRLLHDLGPWSALIAMVFCWRAP
jgi:hypothetical protein